MVLRIAYFAGNNPEAIIQQFNEFSAKKGIGIRPEVVNRAWKSYISVTQTPVQDPQVNNGQPFLAKEYECFVFIDVPPAKKPVSKDQKMKREDYAVDNVRFNVMDDDQEKEIQDLQKQQEEKPIPMTA